MTREELLAPTKDNFLNGLRSVLSEDEFVIFRSFSCGLSDDEMKIKGQLNSRMMTGELYEKFPENIKEALRIEKEQREIETERVSKLSISELMEEFATTLKNMQDNGTEIVVIK